MNPPMKRKTTGSPYGVDASLTVETPSKGNMTIGKSALTGMGMASVIHQVTIQAPKAKTVMLFAVSTPGDTPKKMMQNRAGPSARPMYLVLDRKSVKVKTGCLKAR